MKTVETVGKDIEQALNAGLAELGCKEDDVEVKILVHPGIFRKARVRMTYVGKDESTVEKKTAASVMRNVEERTRKSEDSGGREKNDRAKDFRSDRNAKRPERQNAANAQPPRDEKKVGQGKTNEAKPEKKPAGAVSTNKQKPNEAKPDKKPAQPNKPIAEANKNGGKRDQAKPAFSRDFRAELNASLSGDKPQAQGEAQPRPAQQSGRQDKRNARPEHTPDELEAAETKAVAYLKEITKLMGAESDCVCERADGELNIKLTATDEILVGYNGETIEALEHLAVLATGDNEGRYVHINLDAGGYRAHLTETLVKSANDAADKAVSTGKRVEMEAMSSANRRIVHAALANRTDVVTHSEGRDPARYIVIMPKTAQQQHGGGHNKHRHDNRHRKNVGNNANGGNKENKG